MPPIMGQISLFAFNFAPEGWMFCDGSLLPIAENDVLFELLGTTFGGDGENTFGLPNLTATAPPHLQYCISLFGEFKPSRYEAVIGETMLTGVPLGPTNLMQAAGQLMAKLQYPLLSTYIGTRFGGNAQNFALPDLRNQAPTKFQYLIAVQGDPPSNINARSPFLGEILLLPYQEPTNALLLCNGAQLPIDQNTALYSLIGTTFGGSAGNFALPNLTSVAPASYSYYIVAQGVFGG
jgi:microcystin-dependent protein